MKFQKIAFKFISLSVIISGLILPLPIIADTMPNADEVKTQIVQQATSQTSTINAQPSPSADTSSTNTTTNTGDNNTSNATAQSDSNTQANNQNTSSVDQTTDASANTGNNEASRNISIGGDAGVIQTGDATVNTSAVTQGNTNQTAVNGGSAESSSTNNTTNTGNNNTSAATSNSNSTTLVDNNNTTIVSQTTNATANTGNNVADRNISIGGNAGVITTGNASVNTSYIVTDNGNVILIGGNSNGNGPGSGASIVLANTGDKNHFTSSSNSKQYIMVTNKNRALLSQICGSPIGIDQLVVSASGCTSNTGNNVSDRNIAKGGNAGVIRTADATVNVGMLIAANGNNTVIDPDTQQSNAQINAVNTGDNNAITADSNNTNSVDVKNSNTSNVNQIVNAYANTGNNKANRNISIGGNAGVIQTGNATVNVVMGVQVNNNNTFVNALGLGNTTNNPTTQLNVINTGNDNTISAQSSSTTIDNVQNNSFISLIQKMLANATTGFNSALRNIGAMAGIINTGNATVSVGEDVSANNNTTCINSYTTLCGGSSNSQIPTPTPTSSVLGSSDSSSDPTNSETLSSAGSNTSSNNDDPSPISAVLGASATDPGSILGAATELPATGPDSNLIADFVVLLSAGFAIRKSRPSKKNKMMPRKHDNDVPDELLTRLRTASSYPTSSY